MTPYDFAAARRHIETMIGYQLTNADLLQEALYGGGPIFIGSKFIVEGNTRLAMIGYSALDLALAIKTITVNFREATDGKAAAVSNRRSSIASDGNLSTVGPANRIDACIRWNDGTASVSLKVRTTAIEAVVGAAYLDSGGFEIERRCVDAIGL